MTRARSQAGSAFILILVAIAMFAALSYAVVQGGRTSQSSLTTEQAKLAAREIVAYADTIAKAVQRLRLAGCTETQIGFSFGAQPVWWANNPSSPSDGRCEVFNTNGGKVNAVLLDTSWFAMTTATPYGYPNGEIAITNIGTAAPELIFAISDLKWAICEEINKLIDMPATTFVETMSTPTGNFAGTYVPLANGIGDDVGSPFVGKSEACAKNVNDDGNFVTTLIVR